jgi:hypothetical protein
MKRSDSLLLSVAGKMVVVSCLFVGFAAVTPTLDLFAQQQRGPVQRVVQGRVMDKSSATLQGAVVYLKDGRSLSVKSYISDEKGGYRFGQLSQNTDYEIWAEHNGKKSPVKTISSFDNKNQIYIDLKIDAGK